MLRIGPRGDHMVIYVKEGKRLLRFNLYLPPVEDGIFKPRNIIDASYKFIGSKTPSHPSKYISLYIDISSTQTSQADVIVLANLKRGDWLYTQYTVVPLREQRFVLLSVINSAQNCEIYRTADDLFVTHVEVFEHVTHYWQYVVVNIKVVDAGSSSRINTYIDAKRLYVRHVQEQGIVYFDVTDEDLSLHLEMIYNINTLVAGGDGTNHTNMTAVLA
ncbi:uncharacterized protein BXIN_2503 [Babesia sp. Xinjiang]|nr:uncharacterized protein BXIN_2503 [Babesia sp. Xinjiang]ORM41426.1 hypothetical protein BXIN_2503 [Babesia sp. Xinjiang]